MTPVRGRQDLLTLNRSIQTAGAVSFLRGCRPVIEWLQLTHCSYFTVYHNVEITNQFHLFQLPNNRTVLNRTDRMKCILCRYMIKYCCIEECELSDTGPGNMSKLNWNKGHKGRAPSSGARSNWTINLSRWERSIHFLSLH